MRRINVRRDEGVAMTEFALILPVFLLLVVGMLVVGRLFFYWIETNHVANETARWAIVDQNPYSGQTLQEHARSSATDEFENNVAVCIDFPGKDHATVDLGDPVRVRVQVPVAFAGFFGWGITIKGSSTMRLENISNIVTGNPTAADDANNIGSCT